MQCIPFYVSNGDDQLRMIGIQRNEISLFATTTKKTDQRLQHSTNVQHMLAVNRF